MFPYLIIPVIAGLALVHPFAASAADDNPNDKKLQKAGSVAKAPAHVSAAVIHTPAWGIIHTPTGPAQVAKHQQVNQNTAVVVNHATANPAAQKHVATFKPAAVNTTVSPQVGQQNKYRNVNNTRNVSNSPSTPRSITPRFQTAGDNIPVPIVTVVAGLPVTNIMTGNKPRSMIGTATITAGMTAAGWSSTAVSGLCQDRSLFIKAEGVD